MVLVRYEVKACYVQIWVWCVKVQHKDLGGASDITFVGHLGCTGGLGISGTDH